MWLPHGALGLSSSRSDQVRPSHLVKLTHLVRSSLSLFFYFESCFLSVFRVNLLTSIFGNGSRSILTVVHDMHL